jgi:hypothetical protein
MAENILFTLVDQYGNSLENFKFEGRFAFLYSYPNKKKPEPVVEAGFNGGIAYGDLPKPDKVLESTTLIIEFESEFYNAPGTLVFKGQYQAPQNIAVTKKTLDPKQKNDILEKATEELSQAIQERVNPTSQDIEEPKINL